MQGLERYQGLFFDLDGTLVDSMPYHLEAWQHVAKQFGFACDPDWINGLGGMPSRKILALIELEQNCTLDIAAVCAIKAAHYQKNIDRVQPFSATLAIVRHYFGIIPMAIVTGSPKVNVQRILKNTGLLDYFAVIVDADDVSHHKPAPDTYLRAAEKLHLDPTQCLVFEDTPLGLQASQRAGMDCVLVANGVPQFDMLLQK